MKDQLNRLSGRIPGDRYDGLADWRIERAAMQNAANPVTMAAARRRAAVAA
jgi:hypothetical protein